MRYWDVMKSLFCLSSDIDECSIRWIRRMCGLNKHCVNTSGSYMCICNVGYKDEGNGSCVGKYEFTCCTDTYVTGAGKQVYVHKIHLFIL